MKYSRVKNRLHMLFFLSLLATHISDAQTPRFVNPVEGVYGEDYIINHYVDWQFSGILDYQCGSKTYDGHQGTDYMLKSFAQMDVGVAVLAVDSGVVIAAHDGEFDREMVSDVSKKLGNVIGIKHSGDLYTYYAHLKKNSLLVAVGDTVFPGQKIAEIASSGNSSDPHLHFELWYDSTYVIDPFRGPCGNEGTYWLDPLPYDNSYAVWESGLLNSNPTLNELRERLPNREEFVIGVDTAITFWALQYGLRQGDVSSIEWYTPSNELWYSWVLEYERDWWYHYFWSYIDMPPMGTEGLWRAVYTVNGSIEKEHTFRVKQEVSSVDLENDSFQVTSQNGVVVVEVGQSKELALTLFDVTGRLVASSNQTSFNLPSRVAKHSVLFWVLEINGEVHTGSLFVE